MPFGMDEHDFLFERFSHLDADHPRRQAAVCARPRRRQNQLLRSKRASLEQLIPCAENALRSLLKMPLMRAGCSGWGSLGSTVRGKGA